MSSVKSFSAKIILFLTTIIFCSPNDLWSQNITISKSHNAQTPIQSGQPFTYTLTYGWSGGAPGTLFITDTIASTLDVISAAPSSPVSNISGNIVNFTLNNLNMPSGSGTVQINVRFKPGVTCEGETACNTAYINDDPERNEWIASQQSCVTAAKPENKWEFKKEIFAGCALDNEVIFRISITDPTGSDIGGLNLTNINLEDLLPAGAIITNVSNWWSGPTNSTSNGSTWIPLTGGPTNLQVSPWWQFYVAYVTVEFPSSLFTVGQTVENIAKLEFQTPCDQQTTTWLDTASVDLCQGVQDATLHKSLNLGLYFPNNSFYTPNFSPGCCGTYRLWYKNTGTLPQDNLVMEDNIPGELDVNNIYTSVYTGHGPVTLEIFTWDNGSCSLIPDTTITYNSIGTYTESNLPAEICRLKWSYAGQIDISENIFNRIDVCVRNTNFKDGSQVVPGQTIVTNNVTVTGSNLNMISVDHTKEVDAPEPKILATKLFVGECNDNCQVNPGGPYQPGDTVRYRLAVSNAGGLDANVVSITDDLSSGLSYLGNESYFYGSFNSLSNIYNPPCCSLTTSVPTEIGGAINSPTTGDTSLVWDFAVLPGSCDGSIDYFILEFDAVISEDPPALAGQHPNNFEFDANGINTVTSNTAYLTVNAVAQIQARKEVKEQGSQSAWAEIDTIPQGELADFKIAVINTGNTPLTNLCLLDIMPHIGDIQVLPNYNPRNSTFDLPFDPNNGSITLNQSGYSTEYNNLSLVQSQNPSRTNVCSGFCGISDPQGAVNGNFTNTANQTYSFKLSANQGINLAAGDSLEAIVPAQVSLSTPVGEIACNSFGVSANLLAMPNACLSTESNNACIEVSESVDDGPCFRFGELILDCIKQNEKGNWVYDLSLDITNVSGQDGWIQINPDNGNIFNINPNTVPNNAVTSVTGTYEVSQAPGSVCFDIVMYADGSDEVICDSTICVEYDACDDTGCKCPFDYEIDTRHARPFSGNSIGISNFLNSNATGVSEVRVTIIKSQITETCFFGGTNTYNSPAVFQGASGSNFVGPLGDNTIKWEFPECPPLNNFVPSMTIDVPNSPGYFCNQNIELCIRYEFTDCDCNTCDTTICYDINRKRRPIVWGGSLPIEKGMLKNDDNSSNIDMSSLESGKLTIDVPEGDEYTDAITIYSISIAASDDISLENIKAESAGWSDPENTENGLLISGLINPGESESFDLSYKNPSSIIKWVNTLEIGYSVSDSKDTLYGGLEIVSRTPEALGSDMLENTDPGNNVKNARTFALKFTNQNKGKDSIRKVTLRVQEGSILAVGPGMKIQEFELAGMKKDDGTITLLANMPEKHKAIESGIPAGSDVDPIYITVASDDEESIMLEYITYSAQNDVITQREIELTNPILGINENPGGVIDIMDSFVYPNPASNEVNFKFELYSSTNVTFTVRDMSGSIMSTVVNNELLPGGEHSVSLDTFDFPSGTYYYTIETESESQTGKFVIAK